MWELKVRCRSDENYDMSSEWCLIIATIGRTSEVARLLQSIPTDEAVHIVVIDQNTDGRLDPIVEGFRCSSRHRLTHRHVVAEGVAAARNHGLSEVADATYVAFPDDDCVYLYGTLDSAQTAFADHPEYDALISGWSEIGAHITDSPTLPFTTVSKLGALNDTPTYNLFFRADAVRRAGRFDTDMGLGAQTPWQSGEDTDFLLRAAGLHGRAGRTESVWVQHPANPTRWPAGRAYAYGRGRTQLIRKHGFPARVNIAMALHPALLMFRPSEPSRQARWDSFRGRLRELLAPYRPDKNVHPSQ